MPAVPSFSPISRLALAAGTALGLALLWFGVAFHLGALREAALDTARHNAINLARALEEHIARTIEGLDRIMVHVREEYARDPAGFDPRSLADYPLGDPAQGIAVVDA